MGLDKVEYYHHTYLMYIWMTWVSSLKKLYPGCKIANNIINHLFYADDLVLLCPSHRGLQELLETCEKYALDHGIIFNTKKSVVMIRRSKLLQNAFVQPLKLCNEVLKEVKETKYLGHFLTADGKDDRDMARACRQLCPGKLFNKEVPYVYWKSKDKIIYNLLFSVLLCSSMAVLWDW